MSVIRNIFYSPVGLKKLALSMTNKLADFRIIILKFFFNRFKVRIESHRELDFTGPLSGRFASIPGRWFLSTLRFAGRVPGGGVLEPGVDITELSGDWRGGGDPQKARLR